MSVEQLDLLEHTIYSRAEDKSELLETIRLLILDYSEYRTILSRAINIATENLRRDNKLTKLAQDNLSELKRLYGIAGGKRSKSRRRRQSQSRRKRTQK